jgi:hypothetical protein
MKEDLYEHGVFYFFLSLHHPNNRLEKYLFLSIGLPSIQQQNPVLRQKNIGRNSRPPGPSYAYVLYVT